jgi:hypothetical protein
VTLTGIDVIFVVVTVSTICSAVDGVRIGGAVEVRDVGFMGVVEVAGSTSSLR